MSEEKFNPREHFIQLKSRNGVQDYLPVQFRLVWFREQCPEGTIETKMLHLDLDRETEEEGYIWNNETRRSEKVTKRANGLAVFRAIVKDGKGGCATGTKSEKAASFPDYIEKAETGAIGRALAALGFGTQFTGDELDEGERIVDAPVDSKPASRPESEPPLIVDSMQDLKTKCRNRAYKLGVEKLAQYNTFCHKVIGKAEPETLADITAINAACERQEKKAS